MKIQTDLDLRQTLFNLNEKGDLGKSAGNAFDTAKTAVLLAEKAAAGKGEEQIDGKAAAAMMEKSDRLNGGMILIAEHAKAEEAKQAEEAKRQEPADKRSSKNTQEDSDSHSSWDVTKFSRLSRLLTKDKAYLWKLEMEMELWEALLKWGPFSESDNAGKRLEELSRIYQLLLKAIMENTEGDNRTLQLARLDQGLSEALNRLKDSSLSELFAFLDQCPDGKAAADLRASLYYHVTGRTLSAKEARAFWNAGEQARAGGNPDGRLAGSRGLPQDGFSRTGGLDGQGGGRTGNGSFANGSGQTRGSGLGGNGQARSYSGSGSSRFSGGRAGLQGSAGGAMTDGARSGGNGGSVQGGSGTDMGAGSGKAAIRGRSAYLSSMGSSEEASLMAAGKSEGAGVHASEAIRGKASYSVADLQKTEDFAKYLERGGDLFQNRELTAHNEELLGCLCADLQMKGQFFADGFQLGSRMKASVRSAIDNMIDCYLKQTEHQLQARQEHYPLSRNDVYKVYYYVLKQCQKFQDPRQAISEGLLYASVLFDEKKQGSNRQAERYSREAGFFGAYSASEEEKAKRRRGKRLFTDSWEQFKGLAGQYGMGFETFWRTSPWGMNLSLEAVTGKSHTWRLIGTLVLAAAGLGAALLFHYIAQG